MSDPTPQSPSSPEQPEPKPQAAPAAQPEPQAQAQAQTQAQTESATGTGLSEPSQDSRNLALLNWIGTFFFGFIPCLVLYIVKKDDPYVLDHAKEALNWSITSFIASMVAIVLSFVVIGVLLFPIIGILHIVVCILGLVATTKGETFRMPYILHLIK
ncbi:DUF4870 domain-containing protein [Marinobacter xestospongiae]|uniref:DUF4870 domain-containing protein n=1 Tax=Marinobacter xestospongiae TaxID=994319 RepID=A0ABU3W341_9GAMM|nr:DUF4870 domain-containing protein [Marinobacter xestospongiae]MDV2080765.1 DUF4870 domain-containing protein [Marinobacter xestospongiae]